MDVASRVVGVLLIVAAIRDAFHTIFHPAGRGSLAMLVFRSMWRVTGRIGHRARSRSGPLSMVTVIALWTLLLVLGWALVHASFMPAGFVFASALAPEEQDTLLDAIYYSGVVQSTLGFGDITPDGGLPRILAALQATVGFALFTGAVTWVLSVYPALQRQRALAAAAQAVRRSHALMGRPIQQLPALTVAIQLEALARGISSIRADYLQYPSTFYFAAPDRTSGVSASLAYMNELAEQEWASPEARLAAGELGAALQQLADTVGPQFLGLEDPSRADVVAAVHRHHSPRGR